MTYIACTPTSQSVLFAVLLRRMLQMHRGTIIWKDDHLAKEKNTVHMDSYSHEALAMEYERRYGKVRWFHDHSQERLALAEMLEDTLSRTGDVALMVRCAEAILTDGWDTLRSLLAPSWKETLQFPLLTSRLELAR